MPISRAAFNKKREWRWLVSSVDIEHVLESGDDWFVADLFEPNIPDYPISLHVGQVDNLLSKPDELVNFDASAELKLLDDR